MGLVHPQLDPVAPLDANEGAPFLLPSTERERSPWGRSPPSVPRFTSPGTRTPRPAGASMRNTGDVFSPVAGDNWSPEEVAPLVEPRLSSQACALSSHAMEETGGGRLRYQRHTR